VALLLLLGRNGPIGQVLDQFGVSLPFSTAAVVLSQTFVAIPFMVLAAEAAFRSVDRQQYEVARTLGASQWRQFASVAWPLAAPGIAAGALLSWARAFGEFGATVTFAGSLPGVTETLPLAVYRALESDQDSAIALAVVMLAVSIAVVLVLGTRWLPLGGFGESTGDRLGRFRAGSLSSSDGPVDRGRSLGSLAAASSAGAAFSGAEHPGAAFPTPESLVADRTTPRESLSGAAGAGVTGSRVNSAEVQAVGDANARDPEASPTQEVPAGEARVVDQESPEAQEPPGGDSGLSGPESRAAHESAEVGPVEVGDDLKAFLQIARPDFDVEVSLSVAARDIAVIIGPNGAGKSTVLLTLAGLVAPIQAEVSVGAQLWDDERDHLPTEDRNVGWVPQSGQLFWHMSVLDNVAFGLRCRGGSKEIARHSAGEILAEHGLSQLAGRRASTLSGGQARRIAILRAVAIEPAVLLLDEPTNGLDDRARSAMIGWLRDWLIRYPKPTIMVTHDRQVARELGTDLIQMDLGQVVEAGSREDNYAPR
jgi:molybdate transport system permease protein